MFYCDPCAGAARWPITLAASAGTCEVCGKTGVCSDYPSSLLPLPAAPVATSPADRSQTTGGTT